VSGALRDRVAIVLARHDRFGDGLSVLPGYMSKLPFFSGSRRERRRRMRAAWLWLVLGILVVGMVAGLFYLLYEQGRR
jgi:hypothetical protein